MSFYEDQEIIEESEGFKEGIKRIVTVEGGFDLPQWEYDAVITEEKSDATSGRNNRAIPVARKIIDILEEMDVRVEEIGFYLQKVLQSLKQREGETVLRAFGFRPTNEVEMGQLENEVRISNWDSIK